MSGLKVLGISDLREEAAAGVCAGLALPELDFMFCWSLSLTAENFPRRCSGERLSGARGGFVGAVRRQALGIAGEFREKCRSSLDAWRRYAEFVRERFGTDVGRLCRSFMNVPSVNDLKRIGCGSRFFPEWLLVGRGGNAAFIGRGGTGEAALLSTAAGVLAPDEGPAVIDINDGILFLPRNTSF